MKKINKKGFTLIELLAVIVILAIIMVIATPAIADVIDDAKKGAFKNSAHGIVKSAVFDYSKSLIKGEKVDEITYTYNDSKVTSDPENHKLEFKGTKPENGTIIVNRDGEVALALHDGTYCVEKWYTDNEIKLSKKLKDECKISFPCGEDFIDSRDGNTYETVYITDDEGDNGQCWFAEDLRFKCDDFQTVGTTVGVPIDGWDENSAFCAPGGEGSMLYQWKAAMNWNGEGEPPKEGSQGLCPAGWHIPTDKEWTTLINSVGADPGATLKGNPFNAKLAGCRNTSGSLTYVGSYGYWWTSFPVGLTAWLRYMYSNNSYVNRTTNSQARGLSVRCVSEQ